MPKPICANAIRRPNIGNPQTAPNPTAAADAASAVYSIAAGMPFLDALTDGLLVLAEQGPDPLTDFRILLPTRRACRGLREAFLRRAGGRPLLLPRMLPLGDIDEDELAIREAGEPAEIGAAIPEIPPAIPGLRRQILLARLVVALRGGDLAPEHAARLAVELGRLLDQVQTEQLGFAALAGLVPDTFAEHWQITLDFLRILSEQWPLVLEGEGCIDAADRRNRLLAAQAEAWRRTPPRFPVIAAGSTGSIPATADLLAAVAGLPRGRVVLPGLDRALEPAVRRQIGPSHPQAGMLALLRRLDVDPHKVAEWPAPHFTDTAGERRHLVDTAMHPADATRAWHAMRPVDPAGLDGVTRIDCPAPRDEAGAIALVMRETLETPGKSAALVTHDRGLARRVATELRRWRVEVDDSAGRPLAQTPAATFLMLAARMVAEDFPPVATLAALKHPLAACGRAPAVCRAEVRRLELAALRGPRPPAGLAGLRDHLGAKAADLEPLLAAIDSAAAPFGSLVRQPAADPGAMTDALIGLAEGLAASDDQDGAERLWAGEAGEAVAAFIGELRESADRLGPVDGNRFPALLEALMEGRVVRPRFGLHPRLHIWGPLEARLQQADVLILGGLNEGTWPPETHAGPWMSRPMMLAFGLPLPERRIGLAAHDFVQAFCAPRVVLTRATRVGGTPTVPSRWLLRLETLLAGSGLADRFRPEPRWLTWFAELDRVDEVRPVPPPAPRPPVAVRPRRLSVSRIETWIRDPYAIFARDILGLAPLDPIDADPTAAERGILVHAALERFARTYPRELPQRAVDDLLAIGRDLFAATVAQPGATAFWWPRFARLAEWFVAFERGRRDGGTRVLAIEADGAMEIAGPAGPFRLTGRADRFDRLPGGELAIVDYKTGQTPTRPQVTSGLVPQLSLEAAMVAAGAFAGVAPAPVAELIYLRLTGGRIAGECRTIDDAVAEIAADALAGLTRRIARFDDPATPYLSRPRPMFARESGDYDHLARVKEWSTGAGGEE